MFSVRVLCMMPSVHLSLCPEHICQPRYGQHDTPAAAPFVFRQVGELSQVLDVMSCESLWLETFLCVLCAAVFSWRSRALLYCEKMATPFQLDMLLFRIWISFVFVLHNKAIDMCARLTLTHYDLYRHVCKRIDWTFTDIFEEGGFPETEFSNICECFLNFMNLSLFEFVNGDVTDLYP